MKNLVHILLNKNDKERPLVIDIFKLPFVQGHMQKFVENQGKMALNPYLSAKKDISP